MILFDYLSLTHFWQDCKICYSLLVLFPFVSFATLKDSRSHLKVSIRLKKCYHLLVLILFVSVTLHESALHLKIYFAVLRPISNNIYITLTITYNAVVRCYFLTVTSNLRFTINILPKIRKLSYLKQSLIVRKTKNKL